MTLRARIAIWWFNKTHCCDFETTGTNGFYCPTEQWCRGCNRYQHRILLAKNIGGPVEDWREGKHPKRDQKPKKDPAPNDGDRAS